MMMKNIIKSIQSISTISLTFMVAIYCMLGLNFVLFKRIYYIIEKLDDVNIIFVATIPLVFLSAFTFIFTPFVSKFIGKPFLILVLLASACVNYGAYNLGIVFNQDMMVNIFETTSSEAISYLNIKLIVWILLSGVLPSLYVAFVKIEYKSFLQEGARKALVMLGCVAIVVAIAAFFYKDYASIARNNPKIQKDIVPIYYISSTIKYIKNTYFTEPLAYKAIGEDAKRVVDDENEKYLFIFLVGETARAQSYQLNGYDRETNAYTSKIDNVVSFKNVRSCGTATAVSLPCMFSMMGKSDYSRRQFDSQDNVVDILKRAGYEQIWIDNNTGCKGVCKNISTHATAQIPELHCKGEECTDQVFLNVLDEQIEALNGQEGIIYLHLLGSHGPSYHQRYPLDHAKFKPDCQTSDLQRCTKEEIVNAYDNTILFTDFVMSQVISRLDKYKDNYHTGVIYMSDHGESLGESGLYLHGAPYAFAPEEQTHIPFMVWFSDKMIQHEGLDMECLKNVAQSGKFSHDNLSHTLLDLMDIKTDVYDSSKDMLDMCSDADED